MLEFVSNDNMEKKIKVLVVDDALFMRKAVTDILEEDADIQVLDTAKDGKEGLSKIKKLRPDVITLDIDMPVMDGLTAIRHIMIESPVPIVVLSSLFSDGAITFDALRLGVVDFVPKPSGAISEDITPIFDSKPPGNPSISSCIDAVSATTRSTGSSSPGAPNAMFSRIVSENRKISCGTRPMSLLSSSRGICLTGQPPILTVPSTGS